MVAFFNGPSLHETGHERRANSLGCRAAEEDPLFAAELLPLALGDRGDVDVPHSRADLLQHFFEYRVLQTCRLPDQMDFLRALDRLDQIDPPGRILQRNRLD